jgi:hypothetical protein
MGEKKSSANHYFSGIYLQHQTVQIFIFENKIVFMGPQKEIDIGKNAGIENKIVFMAPQKEIDIGKNALEICERAFDGNSDNNESDVSCGYSFSAERFSCSA